MVVNTDGFFEVPEHVKNQPCHQWVYGALRMNIIHLRLKPGQEVSETEMAARLGISRTPVREAFIRLAEDGLLEIKPQRRSTIARIDLEQAEETRFVRRMLEKSILREACVDFPPSAMERLAENLKVQEKYATLEDYERFLPTDDEFHRIIYEGCRKERVWIFIKKLDNSHDRLRLMTLPLIAERVIEEHRGILKTLADRRGESVDDLVEKHLTNAVIGKVILEYPREYFKQDPRDYARKLGIYMQSSKED